MGSMGKTIVIYNKPFWHNENINTIVLNDFGPV
jgi:hypothetical protein